MGSSERPRKLNFRSEVLNSIQIRHLSATGGAADETQKLKMGVILPNLFPEDEV